MPGSFSRVLGIWLAESPDLLALGSAPSRGAAPARHVGRGSHRRQPHPHLWSSGGWLEIYHGADRTNRYGMGAMLLDADDPATVLARSPQPLLVPELEYERSGFLHDVVFPSGHVPLGDGRIRVYYGAADSNLAAADFEVADILANLDPC